MPRLREHGARARAPDRTRYPTTVSRHDHRSLGNFVYVPGNPANEWLTSEETKGLVGESGGAKAGWYHVQDVHSPS
jgi:hypothetical protein